MTKAGLNRLWRLAGGGWVLLVAVLSLGPPPPLPEVILADKAGHLAAYLWLMLWIGQGGTAGAPSLQRALWLVALGAGLEILQSFTGRYFDPLDMLANALGVVCGWLLLATPLGRSRAWIERRLA